MACRAQAERVPDDVRDVFEGRSEVGPEAYTALLRDWYFDDAIEAWRATWRGFVFPDGISFKGDQFLISNIQDSRFRGESDFTGCHFHEEGNFRHCRFGGPAKFIRARFQGEAFFIDTRFEDSAAFRWCHFWDLAVFTRAHFSKSVDLRELVCDGFCSFRRGKFNGRTNFHLAEFKGQLVLRGTRFEAEALLAKTICSRGVQASGARFRRVLNMQKSIVTGDLVLRSAQFHRGLTLHGANIQGSLDLARSSIRGMVVLGHVKVKGSSMDLGGAIMYNAVSLYESDLQTNIDCTRTRFLEVSISASANCAGV